MTPDVSYEGRVIFFLELDHFEKNNMTLDKDNFEM